MLYFNVALRYNYYAGTERLATVIGQGGFDIMDTCISHLSVPEEDLCTNVFKRYESQYPLGYKSFGASQLNETIKGKQDERVQYKCEPMVLNTVELQYRHDLFFEYLYWASEIHDKESEIYFYHGDHLGSANWITDAVGQPIQYIHYAPFGELIADTRLTNYRERFKFTGKERDEESGYDYFGARYYWSLLMHWLSVDPLAHKYPWISPYTYCNWNPITHKDPNGMLDMRLVGKGMFVSATGVASVLGGASLTGASGGVGTPLGALLIVDGISSVGIGSSLILYGLLTDPGEKNTQLLNTMPTSATNALAKSADIIAGNSNSEIESVVDGVMIGLGMTSKIEQSAANSFSKAMTILQITDQLLETNAPGNRVNISNETPSQNGINSADNTRVEIIEKLRPIPYDYQRTQTIENN